MHTVSRELLHALIGGRISRLGERIDSKQCRAQRLLMVGLWSSIISKPFNGEDLVVAIKKSAIKHHVRPKSYIQNRIEELILFTGKSV